MYKNNWFMIDLSWIFNENSIIRLKKKISSSSILTYCFEDDIIINKKYLSQYRRLGGAGISQAVQLLARADIDLRGGKDLGEELTMEILVARLCRMGASTRSNRPSNSARTTLPKRR